MKSFEIKNEDCREVMRGLPDNSIDSIVTDPPYGLEFMGKGWDRGVPGVEFWTEAIRILKPGGHLLAFGGTRTFHRLTVAIEDSGFEIRDCLSWIYGSGFPKSLDVSKAIDKAAGAKREAVGRQKAFGNARGKGAAGHYANALTGVVGYEIVKDGWDITAPATDSAKQWQGFGTALKPAWEPIILARKPLAGTVAANVLKYGTGAINIDGCRIEGEPWTRDNTSGKAEMYDGWGMRPNIKVNATGGRWPANLIHDGSEEVLAGFPFEKSGSAARFFYCAKASKADRDEGLGLSGGSARLNIHPTVKPTALMRYLCRLVTPPGGLILDPFAGSGSTGKAALLEKFRFLGAELDPAYAEIARARCNAAAASLAPEESDAEASDQLDLFGEG